MLGDEREKEYIDQEYQDQRRKQRYFSDSSRYEDFLSFSHIFFKIFGIDLDQLDYFTKNSIILVSILVSLIICISLYRTLKPYCKKKVVKSNEKKLNNVNTDATKVTKEDISSNNKSKKQN